MAKMSPLKGGGRMNTSKGAVTVPSELSEVLSGDAEARAFFESLREGYKRGYCDWVGGAKQEATRLTRARKSLLMLQRNQKTLKA